MSPEERTTQKFGKLLAAVGELGEDLHGQGVIDLEQLRQVVARRDAPRRVANGESIRQVARDAGVDKDTIRRDLGLKVEQKAPKAEHKAPLEPDGHDLDECGTSHEGSDEAVWRNNLASMAIYSTGLLSHWEKRFKNWRGIKPTIKDVELAESAAKSWTHIATTLKGNM